jgi:hypothetical protein
VVADEGVRPPAVFVIGDVVDLDGRPGPAARPDEDSD